MGELVGMQRLVEFVMMLEQVKPGAAARLDVDEMITSAQEILGAPVKALRPAEEAQDARAQNDNMMQTMTALAAMKEGGEAAQAVGAGGAARQRYVKLEEKRRRLETLYRDTANDDLFADRPGAGEDGCRGPSLVHTAANTPASRITNTGLIEFAHDTGISQPKNVRSTHWST